MNYKTYVLFGVAIISLHACLAIETEGNDASTQKVTSELIQQTNQRFLNFLDQQKENYQKLESWTNPNSWLGSFISNAIELVSPLTRYGHIEPQKTKIFLGRAFENSNALKQAASQLAQSQENIAYLNTLFDELAEHDLKKRDLGALAKTMIGKKHPGVDNTELMGKKDDAGKYIVPDDQFYLFAATNLYATFCVDEEIFIEKKRNKKRAHHAT